MRAIAVVLAGSLLFGCGSNSYVIHHDELQRLAATDPQTRGERVRVVQEISPTPVENAPPVTEDTTVVLVPNVNIGVRGGGGHAGHSGGGVHLGGGGGDGKAEAIAVLVVAAVALFVVAGIEGSRFDGYAKLHPMYPLHLIGRDGTQIIVPLAWLDPPTAAFTERAILRTNEGPWRPLELAPLDRAGFTYAMYGGIGSFKSAYGDLGTGPSFVLQGGYFPEQRFGILASVFMGWRDNRYAATLFETRYTLEVQALPVQVGVFHAGVFGGAGLAYRWEDAAAPVGGGDDAGSTVLDGGAMFQLDINTRLALTGRLSITRAHGEQSHAAMFGLAVY